MGQSQKKQPLNNASEIIERFGGIRPMAAKIDTPVTTVQGWKKRDVIPAGRREQILSAALENDIDLTDLAGGVANQSDGQAEKVESLPRPVKKVAVVEKSNPTSSEPVSFAETVQEETVKAQPQPQPKTQPKPSAQHDELLAAMAQNNRKAITMSAWISVGLLLLAMVVGAIILWPSVQEKERIISQQAQKIEALEDEVKDVNARTSFIKKIVPQDMQADLRDQMDSLQTQARNIQNTMEQLSDRADVIGQDVLGADAGPLSQRLSVLEQQINDMSGTENNFGALIGRIKELENSLVGQEQLKNSVTELRNIVGNNTANLKQNLQDAQNIEGGALGQTLEGVSGNDLKAAAMLIAFSQLRDSLNREAPFEADLDLLRGLVSEDNVELQGALDRLAPHADGGVLTAKGLSSEFKGLTGDIVAASLKGEDVSFTERAKARIGNLLQVEKEGELLSGTQTQMSVSQAQKFLDEGNIEGAITELQSLQGPAAQQAQPFIQEAQISLLAEQAQQMLGENILSKIKAQLPATSMDNIMDSLRTGDSVMPALNMNDVKATLEKTRIFEPEQEVIRDEASGITILPSQPGFKGFSGGQ